MSCALRNEHSAKLRIYFYFSKQRGEKNREKKDFSKITSLTHLWALKAHGYRDKVSGVENALPHSLPHF